VRRHRAGGLARTVLAGDGDDLGVQRDVLDALPVIPVHQLQRFDVKHGLVLIGRSCWRRVRPPRVDRRIERRYGVGCGAEGRFALAACGERLHLERTSARAPLMMRSLSTSVSISRSSSGPSRMHVAAPLDEAHARQRAEVHVHARLLAQLVAEVGQQRACRKCRSRCLRRAAAACPCRTCRSGRRPACWWVSWRSRLGRMICAHSTTSRPRRRAPGRNCCSARLSRAPKIFGSTARVQRQGDMVGVDVVEQLEAAGEPGACRLRRGTVRPTARA
jgi:hypothetical protein